MKGMVKSFTDKFSGPLGRMKELANSPFGDLVRATAGKIKDALVDKAKSLFSGAVDDGTGGMGGGGGAAGAPNSVSGNAAIVKRAAAKYGWDSGGQWNALYQLVKHESGFRNTAQNPSSTAYGLFQFLNSTWRGVGAHKTSNPMAQSIAGLKYVKSAYGTPGKAWSTWQSRSPHWYSEGGVVSPQGPVTDGYFRGTPSARPGLAWVGEKGPELVNFKGGESVMNQSQLNRGGITIGTVQGYTAAEVARAIVREQAKMEALHPIWSNA